MDKWMSGQMNGMANECVGLFPDVLGREKEGQEGRRWFWEVREASS